MNAVVADAAAIHVAEEDAVVVTRNAIPFQGDVVEHVLEVRSRGQDARGPVATRPTDVQSLDGRVVSRQGEHRPVRVLGDDEDVAAP